MQRLVALDGLRGVAAFAVLIGHVARHLPTPYFYPSYLAVDFFFALSGLVLARTYEGKFEGGLSFLAYMERRILRLYPALLAGLALGLAVALARGANDLVWMAALLQAMMLPRLAGPMYPLNDVQWSLFLELLVNALHALIHRWLTATVLAALVAASAVALWALSLWRWEMSGGFAFDNLDLGIARVMFSFFAGVALHRLTARPAPRGPSMSFPVAAIVLILVLATPSGAVPRVLVDLVVVTLVWPVLLYLVIQAPQPVRLHGYADWSGRLSYPLYAVHFPVVTLLAPAIAAADTPMPLRLLLALLAFGLSIIAAMAVERFIERPALARGTRLRAARRSA